MSAWKECPTCDAQFALQASLNDHLTACPGSADKQRIAELEAALAETVLALEYERSRTRTPSVSGATAVARARDILNR